MRASEDILDAMCRIAVEAGEAIMEVYNGEFTVEWKEDESPLTIADLRSNDIICRRLSSLLPEIFIWSEECCSTLFAGKEHKTFFLVDPLDGTKEFLKRNDEFTVNIALIHEGTAIAGVVYAPALDTLYFGGVELGGWRREKGELSKLEAGSGNESMTLRIIASRSHSSPEQEVWLKSLPLGYTLIGVGSSLKFCRIAEGVADVYPRLAPTSQWDTAAAQSILEAAGGRVVDIQGSPIRYGTNMPVLNPWFFAVGSGPAPYIGN